MPTLVLIALFYFSFSPPRSGLRLQGPRSRVLNLSPAAELREANPRLLPRLSPLGYPLPPSLSLHATPPPLARFVSHHLGVRVRE